MDPEPSEPPSVPSGQVAAPAPLVAAAGLTFVQGLLVVLGAVAEALAVVPDRLALGLSTTVFFSLYGVALLVCAWGLHRVRPWARGPVLLAQLVLLGLAWSLRETWQVSAALVVAATVVLAGLLHPRSIVAIESVRDAEAGAD